MLKELQDERINPLIDSIYRTGRIELADGRTIDPFPTSIDHDEGMVLYALTRNGSLRRTLEIGMGWGLSSLFLCSALLDNGGGLHTAIDPFETTDFNSAGLELVGQAGFNDLFRFFGQPSHTALPRLLDNGEQFDLVFIDGDHRFDYAFLDLFYADKLIRQKGYIVFDDIWMPSIRKVIGFLLTNMPYALIEINFTKPAARWIRTGRVIMNYLRNPFDVDSSGLKRIGKFRCCVLQKMGDDNRRWEHFKTF